MVKARFKQFNEARNETVSKLSSFLNGPHGAGSSRAACSSLESLESEPPEDEADLQAMPKLSPSCLLPKPHSDFQWAEVLLPVDALTHESWLHMGHVMRFFSE